MFHKMGTPLMKHRTGLTRSRDRRMKPLTTSRYRRNGESTRSALEVVRPNLVVVAAQEDFLGSSRRLLLSIECIAQDEGETQLTDGVLF